MDNQIVNTMQIKEEFNRLISLAYDKGRVDGYIQGRKDQQKVYEGIEMGLLKEDTGRGIIGISSKEKEFDKKVKEAVDILLTK